ncbi:hypothetical protein JRO89_XS03G0096000 [Xanthoceras sorbifolium]|uniref:Malate dehydrogenase n=1 Tax=Xanthoceras sorbifolium TaxID=99658 RepID=A0ABQ8I9C3_9ROSI|nr:hypothetical protein JRO89_XS03G0096000 [Xanthoceras sorbifolium]
MTYSERHHDLKVSDMLLTNGGGCNIIVVSCHSLPVDKEDFLHIQDQLIVKQVVSKTVRGSLIVEIQSVSMAKEPVRVLVTGAAGQIGYALVPMVARGVMLGADQPVILHMLDIPPAAEALNGVKMELVDAAFPLLKGVVATTDVVEACTGVNIAVMVGGFPRKEGMERKDVMSKNVSIYKAQASALEKHAAANCKYPDVNHATVNTPAGEKPVRELVKDDAWLTAEFITTGTWVSMGVYSDGSYNVPAGLIYSFPVTCRNGEWTIVQGLSIDEFSRKKLDSTAEELTEEKALAYSCLS